MDRPGGPEAQVTAPDGRRYLIGQVPIEQARILRRRVDAADKGDLLVQRVIRDTSHCGFRTTEWEAGFEALVRWVEHGAKPKGTNVLVDDLRTLKGSFELAPRSSPETDAVPQLLGVLP